MSTSSLIGNNLADGQPLALHAAEAEDHPGQPSSRLLSVDLLRGLCVAGMVLVNFPADWVERYHQLGHADWNGATATDMIFPEFLFLAGLSMVCSFGSRAARGQTRVALLRRVLGRSAVLLLLGLVLNSLPTFDLGNLHVFGVLQRIALCYLVGGLAVIATSTDGRSRRVNRPAITAAMVLILVGIWAVVRYVPAPGYGTWRFDHEGNLAAVIDRAVVGTRHMSDWGGPQRMWDADGLLSCVTSTPNLLLGVLTASWLREPADGNQPIMRMLLLSAGLIGLALLANGDYPINRKLWTGSFAVLSGGVSLGLFTICYYALDHRRGGERTNSWWLTPTLVYGSNALLGFILYSLLLVIHGLFKLPGAHEPANWLPPSAYARLCSVIGPDNVSLLYGLAAVGIVLVALWPFHRRKLFWKL